MATETTTSHDVGRSLNELYWTSGRTIDEIVADLGISRNTLYAAIQPQPTGVACSVCGGDVVFTNRTNRAARVGTCESCGMEREVAERRRAPAGEALGEGNGHRPLEDWRIDRLREGVREIEPRRAAMIGGAAAIGALVGVAAIRTLRA